MVKHPSSLLSYIHASEVVSHPVTKIIETLNKYKYNGFPVFGDVYNFRSDEDNFKPNGRLRGFDLNSLLCYKLRCLMKCLQLGMMFL